MNDNRIGKTAALSSFKKAEGPGRPIVQVSEIKVQVRRIQIISARSFDDVVRRLTAPIGQPDMDAFGRSLKTAKTAADLEAARSEERRVGKECW